MPFVRSGLYVCLLSLLCMLGAILLSILLIAGVSQQPETVRGLVLVLTVLAWCGPLCGLAGHVMCVLVPGALVPYVACAVVADGVALFLSRQQAHTQAFGSGYWPSIAILLSLLLFVLFLRQLATFVGRNDLVTRAGYVVANLFIGAVMFIVAPVALTTSRLAGLVFMLMGVMLMVVGLVLYAALVGSLAMATGPGPVTAEGRRGGSVEGAAHERRCAHGPETTSL